MQRKQKSFSEKISDLKAILSGHKRIEDIAPSKHVVIKTNGVYQVDGKEMNQQEYEEWEKNKPIWAFFEEKKNYAEPSWHQSTEGVEVVQSSPKPREENKPLVKRVADTLLSMVNPNRYALADNPHYNKPIPLTPKQQLLASCGTSSEAFEEINNKITGGKELDLAEMKGMINIYIQDQESQYTYWNPIKYR